MTISKETYWPTFAWKTPILYYLYKSGKAENKFILGYDYLSTFSMEKSNWQSTVNIHSCKNKHVRDTCAGRRESLLQPFEMTGMWVSWPLCRERQTGGPGTL